MNNQDYLDQVIEDKLRDLRYANCGSAKEQQLLECLNKLYKLRDGYFDPPEHNKQNFFIIIGENSSCDPEVYGIFTTKINAEHHLKKMCEKFDVCESDYNICQACLNE